MSPEFRCGSTDLRREMEKWVPRTAQHFSVTCSVTDNLKEGIYNAYNVVKIKALQLITCGIISPFIVLEGPIKFTSLRNFVKN